MLLSFPHQLKRQIDLRERALRQYVYAGTIKSNSLQTKRLDQTLWQNYGMEMIAPNQRNHNPPHPRQTTALALRPALENRTTIFVTV
jgi:hypothetical protein